MKDNILLMTDNHGGNIYRASEELGIPERVVMDFSASINPLGVPHSVINVIRENVDTLRHYPDPDAKELTDALASHSNLSPEMVLCGNGSTELIYLTVRALRPVRVLIPAPTFSEYERACRMSDELEFRGYELKRENNFDIDPGCFIRAMEGCDMAFLCNPNNPTGRLIRRDDVIRISGMARTFQCYLIVDEAFIDFIPDESVIDCVADNPYLIVLRSMTKFYALSGLRVGYGVFHPDLINRLKSFKEPWTVNTLALKAGVTALSDKRYQNKTMELIGKEKAFLENAFRRIGLDFTLSFANYYLLRLEDTGYIASSLRSSGILIRECANFRGLDDSYIRVAVRTRDENVKLLSELERLCAAL